MRPFARCTLLALLGALLPGVAPAAQQHAPAGRAAASARIAPELLEALRAAPPDGRVAAYLVMADPLSLDAVEDAVAGLAGDARRAAVIARLRAHASASLDAAQQVLARARAVGTAGRVDELWMGNALIFEAAPSVVWELAALDGVDRVRLVARPDPREVQDGPPALAPSPAAPPAAPLGAGAPPPEPNLVALQAPQLWELGITGDNVLLGTIDSGVWLTHPDLENRIWQNPLEIANGVDDDGNGKIDDLNGWDFINGSGDPTSFDSHGTKSAGIAVGDGSGGQRITGMAPGAQLLACEVLSEAEYWLAQQYCVEQGVDVITSSYSYKWNFSPKPDYHMHRQMCAMELAAGVIHANSIGNQGTQLIALPIPFNIATPGNCPSPFDHPALAEGGRSSVLACGGLLMTDDALYNSSGRGPAAWDDVLQYDPNFPWAQDPELWDYPYGGFAGPGPGLIKPDVMTYTEGIWTTTIGGGYTTFGGTSAATPHLGGALCLLRQVQPRAEPRHLAAAVELSAVDLGPAGKDSTFGSGKLQVFDAARRLRLLTRVTDTSPAIGADFGLAVYGYPNATTFGFFALDIGAGPSDFNLLSPFFSLGVLPLDGTGQLTLNLTVPNDPLLVGLTVWLQFGANVDDAGLWGPGKLVSVPERLSFDA